MISHLKGTIIFKVPGKVIIDVAGVGYTVYVSSETFTSLPSEKGSVSMWTHLAVRENALDLYGFTKREELRFFELLISVPGIGPKSGLAILSLATTEILQKSISSGNTSYLTKVSGIGKKSAEKIVLELKDKLGADSDTGPDLKEETDVVEALKSLGYSLAEVRDALKQINPDTEGTSERVKAAIKILGNNR